MKWTKATIYAQGHGFRWGQDLPKQLIEIDGTPIIQRTYRQLSIFSNDLAVVGWPVFLEYDLPVHSQSEPIGLLIDGLARTSFLWEAADRVHVILGDVVFSNACMKAIETCTDPIKFFGRVKGNPFTGSPHAELFGFSFDGKLLPTVKNHLDWLLQREGCRGNLWSLYRRFIGADYRKHRTERKILQHIGDYTDDIDSIEELERSKTRLDRLVRLDRTN